MSDHRCERLWERYGIDMTQAQVDALLPLCVQGNCMRKSDDGYVHVILWSGIALIPVVRHYPNGRRICTFLDPDTFTAGRRRAAMMETLGKGLRPTGWRRAAHLRKRAMGREVEVGN